jgi:succinate dehydrogenase flavin-adding protein (antitoxin of CptAB toxin-antitoxin module)
MTSRFFLARRLCSPASSSPSGGAGKKEWLAAYLNAPQGGTPVEQGLCARKRRIMFRSRLRGWLELDVLLGSWTAKHVPSMTTESAVARVEALLEAETPHLFEWITMQSRPPPMYEHCGILKSMQEFARGSSVIERR